MKTIIFIDGENFVYQLRDSLAKQRLIRYRDELARVDIRKLLGNVLQDDSAKQAKIQYYAAKVHVIDRTPELKERTERYAADAAVWQKVLSEQNIDYIQAGHLLVRDGKPCQECGHREPVLTEKGVDIHLATDLIRASGDNVRLVLLSSDGDLMPAVEEARRRGAELIYVGFRGVSNAALGRIANKRLTITSKLAAAALGPAQAKTNQAPESKPHQHTTKNVRSKKQASEQTREQTKVTEKPAAPTRSSSTNKSQRPNQAKPDKTSPGSVFTGSRLASMLPVTPPKKGDK